MFERSKIINGLAYKYLVKNERAGKTVRQRVVKYLGPINPVYKKMKRVRKSNAWLFARDISSEEQDVLKQAKRSEDTFCRDRARIILLSASGKECIELAKHLSCDTRKVWNAVEAFNAKGLECLKRGKARGSEPKFTEEIKKNILRDFSKKPGDFDYSFTTWTLPRFTKHLIDHKVVDSISIEAVRQIIIKSGARLKRSKRWQYSPDKEFLKKR